MRIHLEKIELWLKENGDRILDLSLQAPAGESQLKELEAAVGKPLPEDFKQLYRWHNGLSDADNFGSLFYGMDFYSIEQIVEDMHNRKNSENYSEVSFTIANADEAIDPATIKNPAWLKIGFDGSHTALYLDLAPSKSGTYGQIIFVDDEYSKGLLVAESTERLVSDFARDLEQGLYSLDSDALDEGEHYLVADPLISIVNWHNSERWRS